MGVLSTERESILIPRTNSVLLESYSLDFWHWIISHVSIVKTSLTLKPWSHQWTEEVDFLDLYVWAPDWVKQFSLDSEPSGSLKWSGLSIPIVMASAKICLWLGSYKILRYWFACSLFIWEMIMKSTGKVEEEWVRDGKKPLWSTETQSPGDTLLDGMEYLNFTGEGFILDHLPHWLRIAPGWINSRGHCLVWVGFFG